jgi:hypothetical protein
MDLARKDKLLLNIEKTIRDKKNMLINKKKYLVKKTKLNDYLENVKEDYQKYYEYIVKEKQQQYDSLVLLKEYLEDLMQTEKVVNTQFKTAKHDQKDIIQEIDKIKKELDNLML